jgi:nitrilase
LETRFDLFAIDGCCRRLSLSHNHKRAPKPIFSGYARGGSSIIAPLGIPLAGPVEGSQIVHAELQAWMIKAFKSIVDTAGHYSRPDIVRLVLNSNTPSREPLISHRTFFENLSPRVLAENAEVHGVETRRVEELLQAALAPPALIASKNK